MNLTSTGTLDQKSILIDLNHIYVNWKQAGQKRPMGLKLVYFNLFGHVGLILYLGCYRMLYWMLWRSKFVSKECSHDVRVVVINNQNFLKRQFLSKPRPRPPKFKSLSRKVKCKLTFSVSSNPYLSIYTQTQPVDFGQTSWISLWSLKLEWTPGIRPFIPTELLSTFFVLTLKWRRIDYIRSSVENLLKLIRRYWQPFVYFFCQ